MTDRALTIAPATGLADTSRARQRGDLESALRSGRRVLIVEARPPDGPDLEPLARAVARLGPCIDAIQLTDMPYATPHVANLAAGARLRAEGHEVVINVACRDRNLIAQQGTLLGAAALGIQNVFCIRGDSVEVGDHPTSVGVFETSGLGLIALAKRLNERSAYQSGRPFNPAPALFVGAALAPHAPYGDGVDRLLPRKWEAGADFLVTQPLCDDSTLARLLARTAGVPPGRFLLAGVGAITNLEVLDALTSSSEVFVPPDFAEDLRNAPERMRAQVGFDHALSVVRSALVAGAHGVLLYPFACDVERTRELSESMQAVLAERERIEGAGR